MLSFVPYLQALVRAPLNEMRVQWWKDASFPHSCLSVDNRLSVLSGVCSMPDGTLGHCVESAKTCEVF